MVPDPVLQVAIGGVDASEAVLLPLEPGARVSVVVWHHVYSVALPLVSDKEAFVPAAISPRIHAEAAYFAVFPFSCELTVVCPGVFAKPINLTVDPIALIRSTILPFVQAESILFAIRISAFEAGAIRPSLDSHSFLRILKPLSFVLAAVSVLGDADTVTHVIVPLPRVCLTSFMRKGTFTMGMSQVPISFIDCTILESHFALAMSEVTKPFAVVAGAVLFICVLSPFQFELKFLSAIRLKQRDLQTFQVV